MRACNAEGIAGLQHVGDLVCAIRSAGANVIFCFCLQVEWRLPQLELILAWYVGCSVFSLCSCESFLGTKQRRGRKRKTEGPLCKFGPSASRPDWSFCRRRATRS